MKTRKLTNTAVLAAFSLAIFVLESHIPPLVPLYGVKLGLANVVTLYAKATLGTRCALAVLVIKIFLGNFFAGSAVSLIYSLFGGTLCFVVEMLMFRIVEKRQIWAVSVTGAIFHNIGQIIAATILMGTEKILWYLTILVPVGILTGTFTGICAMYTLKATEKIHDRR